MFAQLNAMFSEGLWVRSQSHGLFEGCRLPFLQTFRALRYLNNPNMPRNKTQWGEIYEPRFVVLTK